MRKVLMRNLYKHPNDPRWFLCADLHLDHPDILIHNPITRPFKTLDDMHSFIVDGWNSTVRRNDFVVIVGDFAFRNVEKWAKLLCGKKYLIKGDHDSINQDNEKLFLKVCDNLRKTIFGRRIFFHHFPCLTWPDRYEGGSHIHGHSHGRTEENEYDRRIDVSMDAWGLRVIPIEIIFEKLDSKKPLPPMTDRERCEREERKRLLIRGNLNLLKIYDESIGKTKEK